jgi:hypothetical protein
MKWLLEPDVFQTDLKPFITKLESLGIQRTICQFGKSYEEQLEPLTDDHVFVGSMQFAKVIHSKRKWAGLFWNLPKFDCLYYYPRFQNHLLNSNYTMLPFGDLNRRKDWLLKSVGEDGYVFIRPSSGGKSFTGKVIGEKTWAQDVKACGLADPEMLVVAATPVNLSREWRLVVVDKKIVASTQYKEAGKTIRSPETPQAVLDYGDMVLKSVSYAPDRAWVMDVCESELVVVVVLRRAW